MSPPCPNFVLLAQIFCVLLSLLFGNYGILCGVVGLVGAARTDFVGCAGHVLTAERLKQRKEYGRYTINKGDTTMKVELFSVIADAPDRLPPHSFFVAVKEPIARSKKQGT